MISSVSCELLNMKLPCRNSWICEVSEPGNYVAGANALANGILSVPLLSFMNQNWLWI